MRQSLDSGIDTFNRPTLHNVPRMSVDAEASPSRLLAHAASDPAGVMLALEAIADEPTNCLGVELDEMLSCVGGDQLGAVLLDEHFLFFYGDRPSDVRDRQARLQIVGRALEHRIDKLRLDLLMERTSTGRPYPYDHPALADLSVAEDGLVPLSEFEVDGLALSRKGHTFAPVPAVNGQNAAYWFMQTVVSRDLADSMWIRLDPLMHRPSAEFGRMHYKMWLFGRHLDLTELVGLAEEQFGRWHPGRLSRAVEFTDYVWSPRSGELHLTLEEFPKQTDIEARGSRYLHAIYTPASDTFIHLDGAIRIFDSSQWVSRAAVHVRTAGKAGVRVKTFRCEGEVTMEVMTSLVASYFVWNYDVAKFCGVPIPERLLA
jgi:hypothetical protein